jgi:hypothetical protein
LICGINQQENAEKQARMYAGLKHSSCTAFAKEEGGTIERQYK